ncbi:hypothetical protein P8452_57327 [Trifolium repens]|nr:hypothetical protein P8452_57327 [Trifolium repens]
MLYGPIIFNVFHFLLLFLSIHRFYYLLSIPYLLQSSSNLLLPLSDGFHRPINEISCEGTTGTIQIHYRWFDSETKILLLSNCISSPYRNR